MRPARPLTLAGLDGRHHIGHRRIGAELQHMRAVCRQQEGSSARHFTTMREAASGAKPSGVLNHTATCFRPHGAPGRAVPPLTRPHEHHGVLCFATRQILPSSQRKRLREALRVPKAQAWPGRMGVLIHIQPALPCRPGNHLTSCI